MNEVYDRLRNATYNLFPKTGAWSSDCFKKGEDSFIAHLRNPKWLTKRFKEMLPDVDNETIVAFVCESEFFKEQRQNYEQMVIRWQIEWMINGGENWLVRDEFGGDFISFSPNCDIGFRTGILDTLLAIGMNRDAIEEGIERNAKLWRDAEMIKAFKNQYEPIDLLIRKSDTPFEPTTKEHLEKWLRLRRHQYYQDHKDSVDKYGFEKNGMSLSLETVDILTDELATLDQERMEYLRSFKEKSTVITYSFNSLTDPPHNEESPTTLETIQEAPKKGVKSLIKRFLS